jgi:hypothetical protein
LGGTAKTRISVEAMELVFQLCEEPSPEIARHVLDMHFKSLGPELIAAGALVETAPGATVMMPIDFDDEPVEFEWEPDLEAYAAFHPSRGWLLADHDARRRYRLDLEWLLRLIARDLGLRADGRVVALEPDLLWDLGETWAGRRRAAVLYARRLGYPDELDRVCGGLKRRVGRRPGVVLTTCLGVSQHIHVPGYRIVSLRECVGRTRGAVVDPDVIADALDAQGSPEPGPVRASVDFSTITVGDRMFYFRGSKQRQVVQYLYEQWQAGQPRVSVSRMWTDLDFPDSTRLRDLFKGHPDWQDLIAYEQGLCWLKI